MGCNLHMLYSTVFGGRVGFDGSDSGVQALIVKHGLRLVNERSLVDQSATLIRAPGCTRAAGVGGGGGVVGWPGQCIMAGSHPAGVLGGVPTGAFGTVFQCFSVFSRIFSDFRVFFTEFQ